MNYLVHKKEQAFDWTKYGIDTVFFRQYLRNSTDGLWKRN